MSRNSFWKCLGKKKLEENKRGDGVRGECLSLSIFHLQRSLGLAKTPLVKHLWGDTCFRGLLCPFKWESALKHGIIIIYKKIKINHGPYLGVHCGCSELHIRHTFWAWSQRKWPSEVTHVQRALLMAMRQSYCSHDTAPFLILLGGNMDRPAPHLPVMQRSGQFQEPPQYRCACTSTSPTPRSVLFLSCSGKPILN